MFGKLLVALDGSRLAECALEPAFELGTKFASDIILFRSIIPAGQADLAGGVEPLYPAGAAATAQFFREDAEAYLRDIEARYRSAGLKVRLEVSTGEPALTITALADSCGVDLIVMSTHGRSGIMRLLYGSVAEAVLRGTHTPLLLVPIAGREELQSGSRTR